ncbi:MAG: hypothetical protein AAFV47_08535 [Pseudomonadota bacterium]
MKRSQSLGDTPSILAAAVAGVLACAGNAVAGPDLSGTRSMTETGKIQPLSEEDKAAAKLGLDALAEHLGIDADTITVDTVRTIQWRDSSIGCPQPGEAYGQVVTPGHKITLRVDDDIHVAHEANGRAFICQRTKRVADVTGSGEFVWAKQALVARKSLADTLGVELQSIRVESAKRMTWPTTGIGCPGPTDIQANVNGYILTLRHAERRFTYNTDLNRVIACPAIETD